MQAKDGYLTGPQVQDKFQISDVTLWRWVNDTSLNFPQPMVVKRRRYFLASAIDVWAARQASEVAA